jgi:hypothetical protein
MGSSPSTRTDTAGSAGASTMRGLVEYLAKALVDDPAPVEVHAGGSGDEQLYRLKVARDDLGKVIGKKGRTAKAFRTLLAAAGAKQATRVTLEILEPESGQTDVPAAASPAEKGAAVDDDAP